MRFVKLTCVKFGETYIDLTKIVTMWRDDKEKNTVIRFTSTDHLVVKETPEEILTSLRTIGG